MEQEQPHGDAVELLSAEQLEQLNPGIRMMVQWLREMGFDTRDSGDGRTHQFECDLPIPYVHIMVEPAKLVEETDRLMRLLAKVGIEIEPCDEEGKVPSIESVYLPANRMGLISVFNVTLHPDQCDFGKHQRGGLSHEEWVEKQHEHAKRYA